MADPTLIFNGMRLYAGYLDDDRQKALADILRDVVRQAPLFTPVMPRTGKVFSVQMTNCGTLGWVSDRQGYRYQPTHPVTGAPWPAMPPVLLDLWQDLTDYPAPPEACLVNYYDPDAKMGLHQDRDEADFDAPVLSVSLGDTAVFRLGGASRKASTRSFDLNSGDVLLLDGDSRFAFHGIDRIKAGSSRLLSKPGRINLTLRRVNPA